MSKKDFVLIAQIISAYRSEMTGAVRKENSGEEMAHRLADAFQAAFPKFKRDVFLNACKAVRNDAF